MPTRKINKLADLVPPYALHDVIVHKGIGFYEVLSKLQQNNPAIDLRMCSIGTDLYEIYGSDTSVITTITLAE